MLEAERIAKDPSVKGYNDLDELFADLKNEGNKSTPSSTQPALRRTTNGNRGEKPQIAAGESYVA